MSASNEITEEQRGQLESQFGKLLVMGTDQGDFAFKVASLEVYRRWSEDNESPKSKFDGFRVLALNCVVWPSKEALQEAFSAAPGLVHIVGNEVAIHSGLTQAAARKK